MGVFAEHASKLRREGWAVLPANGKAPIRSGFPSWKRAPGLKAIEEWAQETPDADIVFVPGLSRTEDGCEVVTFDADDMEASDSIESTFGATPAKTWTRKGRHHHYKLPGGTNLGKLHSLRPYGHNIDVKHGQAGAGIVVAPPSRHADERNFAYAWDGCDETVIRDLPSLDVKALFNLIRDAEEWAGGAAGGRYSYIIGPGEPSICNSQMRDGSRAQHLNDRLVSAVWDCANLNELQERAFQINATFISRNLNPLDAAEVVERAAKVWKDREAGKFNDWRQRRATVTARGDEIDMLLQCFGNGADAFTLLCKLRADHGARVARGETFVLSLEGMVDAGLFKGWGVKRLRNARKALIEAGFIRLVSPANRGRKIAATYTLAA